MGPTEDSLTTSKHKEGKVSIVFPVTGGWGSRAALVSAGARASGTVVTMSSCDCGPAVSRTASRLAGWDGRVGRGVSTGVVAPSAGAVRGLPSRGSRRRDSGLDLSASGYGGVAV